MQLQVFKVHVGYASAHGVPWISPKSHFNTQTSKAMRCVSLLNSPRWSPHSPSYTAWLPRTQIELLGFSGKHTPLTTWQASFIKPESSPSFQAQSLALFFNSNSLPLALNHLNFLFEMPFGCIFSFLFPLLPPFSRPLGCQLWTTTITFTFCSQACTETCLASQIYLPKMLIYNLFCCLMCWGTPLLVGSNPGLLNWFSRSLLIWLFLTFSFIIPNEHSVGQ